MGASGWNLALGACALVLVFEGLLPFCSPSAWRRVFEAALLLRDGQIRFLGLLGILAGLALFFVFLS